jgi:hypothetical protein
VDAADYIVWRMTLGASVPQQYDGADGDGDSQVDGDDYPVWTQHFGETLPGAGGGSTEVASFTASGQSQGVEPGAKAASSRVDWPVRYRIESPFGASASSTTIGNAEASVAAADDGLLNLIETQFDRSEDATDRDSTVSDDVINGEANDEALGQLFEDLHGEFAIAALDD